MAVVNKCLNGLIEVVGTLNIIKLNYRRFYSLIVFIIVLLQTILTQIVRENVFKIKTVRVNVVTLKSCKHVVCLYCLRLALHQLHLGFRIHKRCIQL